LKEGDAWIVRESGSDDFWATNAPAALFVTVATVIIVVAKDGDDRGDIREALHESRKAFELGFIIKFIEAVHKVAK
jgi:hypothetical protein